MIMWVWIFCGASVALLLTMTIIEKARESKARKAAKQRENNVQP